jgi:flagellar basal body P-ring formation protein FlgA
MMNAARWALVTVAALVLSGVAQAAAPARIVLKSEAVVTERQVRLGALATIESSELATVERLVAMPVAMAPRPGYTERITREELKRRLRTVTPGIRSPLAWEGADAVRIELATSLVEGDRLRAMAIEHARSAFAPRFAAVDVAALENVADVAVPPGALTLRPRVLQPEALARRVPVWIDVFVDNVFLRAVAVAVQVEAFAPALVARAPLAAGREVKAADFEARRVDYAALGAPAIDTGTALDGLRLKRAMRAHAVLLAADLEPRPAVARGAPVTLQMTTQSVRLEVRATALADAAVGENIWVKREPAGESLRAHVVAPGIVEIALK